MSKLKSKKLRKTNNPTGIPTEKIFEMFMENYPTSDVESIVEKLKSPCAEEREIGAIIIANMANKQEFVTNLIEKKIIRVAAPLLIDRSPGVRHAIAGSLRNIAVCNDYLVSEAMVEQDIMTCLVTLFEQYKEPWTSVKSVEKKSDKKSEKNDQKPEIIDQKSEIFLEACNLLWTLCENSSIAVTVFNDRNLISILLPCLTIENFDIKIPIAVAQCLHTVSENNPAVIDILLQPLIQEQLEALMSLSSTEPEYHLLRVLGAGIKLNVYIKKLDDCMSDVTTPIINAISSALSEPISPMLDDLSNKIACQKAGRLDKYHEEKDLELESMAVVKAEEALDHLLSAKQTSLEILGNIFEGGSDDESDYVSCSETSEEMEMDVEDDTTSYDYECKLPNDLYEAIVSSKLCEKVQEQIIFPSDEAERNIKSHPSAKDSLKRLHSMRCTALLCLNNMIPKLEVEDVGGPSKLLELWLKIANLLFKNTDMSDTDQVEAATHCLRAVLEKLASSGFTSHFDSMTDKDLELLINLYTMSEDPRIKVHVIGSLGIVGKILCQVKTPMAAKLIKIIGTFLLEICNKNTDVWVLSEIYDAIIDVFSDDDVDFIAKEIGLVESLTRLKPHFERRFKQQRKLLGERAEVIRTAKDNLKNFIKYKNAFFNKK